MRIVRLVTLSCFAALLSFVPVQAATVISDPVKFVTALYVKMAAATPNKPYVAPDDIYTPRLEALFALDKKEAGTDVGRMDFDIWSNAQDWQLSAVKVTGTPIANATGRERVVAKFKNNGKPEEVHFYFEKGKAGWQLDDARSLVGETWTLSLILKYGWDSDN